MLSIVHFFQGQKEAHFFKPGDVIFQEGESGDLMYVVTEGEVTILYHKRVIEVVGPGGILGEMALIDDNPRSAGAVAKTDCQLIPVSKHRFIQLVQQAPHFSIQVMRVMADRLRRVTALRA